MKWPLFALAASFLFTGCAQVFDGNLFDSFDNPPPLTAAALGSKSAADLKKLIDNDTSFFDQLKDNPTALAAAQGVLDDDFTIAKTTAAKAGTPAEKAALVESAQAYVLMTAFSSDAGSVATAAIQQASKLMSGTEADSKAALTSLFAGKTEAQIKATLDQFMNISNASLAMQAAATSSGTVSDSTFLGPTTDGDFVQTALVAGAVSAFVNGTPATSVASLANIIATGGTFPTINSNFTSALTASSPPAAPAAYPPANNNEFAYLYTLKNAILP